MLGTAHNSCLFVFCQCPTSSKCHHPSSSLCLTGLYNLWPVFVLIAIFHQVLFHLESNDKAHIFD